MYPSGSLALAAKGIPSISRYWLALDQLSKASAPAVSTWFLASGGI
jgi:hypothetical protein